MTYEETIKYLYNQTPLFQNVGKKAYKEGLDTTFILDEHFRHPHRSYKTIHVAGTNGKGSCSHTIAAILQLSGYKVGLYTSPHLLDFRERIRVNGEKIPTDYVVDFVAREKDFFEPLHPSFFELTTAMAFKYFEETKVDIAVIEVGLGGRLDCTNIITPILSIITNISFDHTNILGCNMEQIAREKAGIIKQNVPVVVGVTTKETAPVFVSESRNKESDLYIATENAEVLECQETKSGNFYKTRHFGEFTGELVGKHQAENTGTILKSLLVLDKLGYPICRTDVQHGFLKVCELTGLMGRWQVIGNEPLVICDTGHNEGGWKYISERLSSISEEDTLHVILGMASDKDIESVLALLPSAANYCFTQASTPRALSASELKRIASLKGLTGESFNSVEKAYLSTLKKAKSSDVIFVGGSNFVVADLLAYLRRSVDNVK